MKPMDNVNVSSLALTGERLFKDLLESAPDAMVIVNHHGTIVLINSQTERLFGYSRDELLGKPIEILVPLSARAKHVDQRNHFFSNPRERPMCSALDLRAVRKDGSEFPAEISLSPLVTDNGMLVSSAIRDITDRKLAQEKLKSAYDDLEKRVQERTVKLTELNAQLQAEIRERKKMEEELKRSNDELEQFAYVASHDLQEPLRAISTNCQELQSRYAGKLDSDADECLHFATTGARRMQALIRGLLEYARVGREEHKTQPVDCQAVVSELIEQLKPSITEQGAEIVCDNLPTIQGIPFHIRQLFQNLIDNA
ncbi:MAG: PAS domain S-box protein, partial [Deltaproteobacteria bacterium]|nr:PAS domain S-box protein [Deltaproteobacteria bacterium]